MWCRDTGVTDAARTAGAAGALLKLLLVVYCNSKCNETVMSISILVFDHKFKEFVYQLPFYWFLINISISSLKVFSNTVLH